MCGIGGIFSFDGKVAGITESIIKMSLSLQHRGPDDEGFLIIDENNLECYGGNDTPIEYYQYSIKYAPQKHLEPKPAIAALMHRRLSIIDLSVTGHQPLNYKDLWIVFNGEIYNYRELRKELEDLGHQFISSTDTEVVLAAYLQWGETCVDKFNGMWAFCIFSPLQNTLFISRDKLGVKPFYYCISSKYFLFASEQKALFASGLVERRIKPEGFIDYFVLDEYEQEEESFFENIKELFPGYNLIIDLNQKNFELNQYFNPHINCSFEIFDKQNFDFYKSELKEKLTQAVALRLRGDVPVGSCLSGGIDSSAVVLLAHQINPLLKMNLFTAAFNEDGLGEQKFAEVVSKKVNGNWFTVYPTANELNKDLQDLIFSQDIPIWSTSTYAQYSVMRLAKQNNTKVLLDGQGSDELFGGYPIHWIPFFMELFRNENWVSAFRNFRLSGLPFKNLLKRYLADFYLKRLNPKVQLQILRKTRPELIALSPDLESLILERIKNSSERFFTKTPGLNEFLFYETYNHRLKSYLKCEDRASMRHSVEARTPFSDDTSLIELAFKIPGNLKINKGQLKYLLRESVKDQLPLEVYLRRDKMGYNTPNDIWIENLYKNNNFFEKQNNLLNTKALRKDFPKLLHKNNPRLFKVLVSDIWLNY